MRLERMRDYAPKKMRLRQQGNVRKNDPPPLRKADPGLALATARNPPPGLPFEGYRDAGKAFSERNNLKPGDRSRQVGWGSPFAKGFNLADPVESLVGAKTRDVRGGPEHIHQGIYVVRD